MTTAVVVTWIAVFVWCWRMPVSEAADTLTAYALHVDHLARWWSGVSTRVEGAEAWMELVRSAFGHLWFHVGIVGLAADAVFFFACGSRLEARAGSVRFLSFLVVSVSATLGIHVWAGHPEADAVQPIVGGALLTAPVLGAYLLLHGRAHLVCLVPPCVARIPFVVGLVAWAVAQWRPLQCLLRVGEVEPVPWVLVGEAAAVGLVLGWVLRARTQPASGRPRPRAKR